MSLFLVHFPVIIAVLSAVMFTGLFVVQGSLFLLIFVWQSLAAAVLLAVDGKNRYRRYLKLLAMAQRGINIQKIKREATLCNWLIWKSVVITMNAASGL